MKSFANVLLLAGSLVLTSCASGPPRRVSEPTASIQQLTVRADGSWSVELRIENFSNVSMRFDNVRLALSVAGEAAGTLQSTPALAIGPESADVTTLALQPSAPARIVLADALARGRGISYTLEGTLAAAAGDGGARDYQFKRDNGLSPVPGLAGVMR